MSGDWLRDALADDGHAKTFKVDPPFSCPRCGRIFEGAIRNEVGKALTRTHVVGDPRICPSKGSPVWDFRARRQQRP